MADNAVDTQELQTLFENEFKPSLVELDGIRKQAVKRLWIGVICVPLICIPILLASLQMSHDIHNGLTPSIIILLGFGIFYGIKWREYRTGYKKQVVKNLVSLLHPQLSYQQQGKVNFNSYMQSGLYTRTVDDYKGEDYVYGLIGKTKIEFSEIHSQYKTTSNNSSGSRKTYWHTIFQGIFVIADFNKHFQGKTFIVPDEQGLLSSISNFLRDKYGAMGESVKLENPEFERYFDVYSSDQVESRYILSPSLMEHLVSFRERSGSKVRLSFVEENLYLAIPSRKNHFEPKIFQPAASFPMMLEIYADLKFLTDVVEDLDLNTRIWTKE